MSLFQPGHGCQAPKSSAFMGPSHRKNNGSQDPTAQSPAHSLPHQLSSSLVTLPGWNVAMTQACWDVAGCGQAMCLSPQVASVRCVQVWSTGSCWGTRPGFWQSPCLLGGGVWRMSAAQLSLSLGRGRKALRFCTTEPLLCVPWRDGNLRGTCRPPAPPGSGSAWMSTEHSHTEQGLGVP